MEWKTIDSYPEYQVSDTGEVRSLRLNRALKQSNSHGYKSVSFNRKYNKRHHLVHRLVAEAFLGSSNLEVNHINGIKSDNRVGNLEWVSHLDNVRHAFKTGLVNSAKKLTPTLVTFIILASNRHSQREVARMFKVSETTVHEILKGKTWNSPKH